MTLIMSHFLKFAAPFLIAQASIAKANKGRKMSQALLLRRASVASEGSRASAGSRTGTCSSRVIVTVIHQNVIPII